MSNIRSILGALIITAACSLTETKKYSIVKTNPQKRNSTKKVKNKKIGCKQAKYSSTKPMKSKVKTQFRNKSNI
jgi:hypothetical protein